MTVRALVSQSPEVGLVTNGLILASEQLSKLVISNRAVSRPVLFGFLQTKLQQQVLSLSDKSFLVGTLSSIAGAPRHRLGPAQTRDPTNGVALRAFCRHVSSRAGEEG